MNHIELFAGCGGLSLGLEQEGFSRILANELSPMAAETFAYNFLHEDLEEKATQGIQAENVKWIKSDHKDLKSRLRENPFAVKGLNSDIPDKGSYSTLEGKLLVGSIIDLNVLLEESDDFVQALATGFQKNGSLDLVSGGPPCQSFSMAGKREKDNDKNTLPWEFAKFVNLVKPKIVLLENVTGILRAFQDDNGQKFHAWYEVAKVFSSIGYIPLCLHINARYVGVPQNRPRFIMLAVRKDILENILNKSDDVDKELWSQSISFYKKVELNQNLEFGHLEYIDVMKADGMKTFLNSFLNPLVSSASKEVSVQDAIDDLKINNPTPASPYVMNLNKTFSVLSAHSKGLNHDLRNNSPIVKRRFRIYQVLQQIGDRQITKRIFDILRGNTVEVEEKDWELLRDFSFLREDGELQPFENKSSFENYLIAHPTKKQTQKALMAHAPAPAALSIPDDACHYDEHELRVLSVREMARIQSFPDNFVFRSKITTGGQMRKFEVPQYTQVGNAVPPLLGKALGKIVKTLLERIN